MKTGFAAFKAHRKELIDLSQTYLIQVNTIYLYKGIFQFPSVFGSLRGLIYESFSGGLGATSPLAQTLAKSSAIVANSDGTYQFRFRGRHRQMNDIFLREGPTQVVYRKQAELDAHFLEYLKLLKTPQKREVYLDAAKKMLAVAEKENFQYQARLITIMKIFIEQYEKHQQGDAYGPAKQLGQDLLQKRFDRAKALFVSPTEASSIVTRGMYKYTLHLERLSEDVQQMIYYGLDEASPEIALPLENIDMAIEMAGALNSEGFLGLM